MILDRLLQLVRRLARQEEGAVLPLVGLSLPMLLGFGALALDAGQLYVSKNRLQIAADFAALSAVRELEKNTGQATSKALQMAEANMPAMLYGQTLVGKDVEIGAWNKTLRTFTPGSASANAVRVTTRRTQDTFLAGLLGHPTVEVSAVSIAWRVPALPLCILALNPTRTQALDVTGSAKLRANDCIVQVNSSAASAVSLKPAAWLTSLRTLVVGTATGTNFNPRPETGSPPIPDPLSGLPAPSVSGCSYTNRAVSGTVTIQPGTYCGGLSIGNNAVVTFAPGLYVIDNGPLTAGGTATIRGQGVTIYLRGALGRIDFSGGPTLDMSAPTSGTYAGVLVYADRAQTGLTHKLTGNSSFKLDGTLYIPTGHVDFNGSSSAAITMMIADTIAFGGSSDFQRRTSQTNVPLPAGFSGLGSATKGMALLAQ